MASKQPAYDPDFLANIGPLINSEGGYVNHPRDPGGETKFGITKASYPNLDIKNLTKEQAVDIYYKNYWLRSGADKLEDPALKAIHFDAAVNHGVGAAKKFLRASGGDYDAYKNVRLVAYHNDPNYDAFGKGWENRIKHLDERVKKKDRVDVAGYGQALRKYESSRKPEAGIFDSLKQGLLSGATAGTYRPSQYVDANASTLGQLAGGLIPYGVGAVGGGLAGGPAGAVAGLGAAGGAVGALSEINQQQREIEGGQRAQFNPNRVGTSSLFNAAGAVLPVAPAGLKALPRVLTGAATGAALTGGGELVGNAIDTDVQRSPVEPLLAGGGLGALVAALSGGKVKPGAIDVPPAAQKELLRLTGGFDQPVESEAIRQLTGGKTLALPGMKQVETPGGGILEVPAGRAPEIQTRLPGDGGVLLPERGKTITPEQVILAKAAAEAPVVDPIQQGSILRAFSSKPNPKLELQALRELGEPKATMVKKGGVNILTKDPDAVVVPDILQQVRKEKPTVMVEGRPAQVVGMVEDLTTGQRHVNVKFNGTTEKAVRPIEEVQGLEAYTQPKPSVAPSVPQQPTPTVPFQTPVDANPIVGRKAFQIPTIDDLKAGGQFDALSGARQQPVSFVDNAGVSQRNEVVQINPQATALVLGKAIRLNQAAMLAGDASRGMAVQFRYLAKVGKTTKVEDSILTPQHFVQEGNSLKVGGLNGEGNYRTYDIDNLVPVEGRQSGILELPTRSDATPILTPSGAKSAPKTLQGEMLKQAKAASAIYQANPTSTKFKELADIVHGNGKVSSVLQKLNSFSEKELDELNNAIKPITGGC